MADTISQNPAGLCGRDTKEISKPKDMIVASTNLGINNSVDKLATKGIQEIIRIVIRNHKMLVEMSWRRMAYYTARITTNTLTGKLSFPLIL